MEGGIAEGSEVFDGEVDPWFDEVAKLEFEFEKGLEKAINQSEADKPTTR